MKVFRNSLLKQEELSFSRCLKILWLSLLLRVYPDKRQRALVGNVLSRRMYSRYVDGLNLDNLAQAGQ